MKLIENNWWLTKQVDYKGNLLIVPVWTNWICIDPDGFIGVSKYEPHFDYSWCNCFWIGKAELDEGESWKESLVYVGEEQ